MYTEVLTSGNSAVTSAEEWDQICHREYIGQLKMKWLMGTSPNSVLQVKENLTKKAGDALTIHFASGQTGGTVRGNTMGIGNEGNMDFHAQRFVIDNVRNLHKVWDIPMTEKRTTFGVLVEAKHALNVKHAETFDDDFVTGLTDVSIGRVRGRYLYGASDSNWNATHGSGLGAIDTTNDKLTGAIIGVAKRKALNLGGTPSTGAEIKIRPTRIMNGLKAEEWYIFLAHTYAIRDLINEDAAFRNQQLLLPPGSNSNSLYYSGSHFKGSWEGVLIYEYDRLPTNTSGSGSAQVSHNLLMGAQAGAVVWGQRTKFGEEFTDLKHNVTYEYHDIRNRNGLAAGSYNVKMVRNSVDHGIVNVFTSAADD